MKSKKTGNVVAKSRMSLHVKCNYIRSCDLETNELCWTC